jgi:sodium transport system permease protein
MLAWILTIFRKEIRDALRDRRSVFLALLYGVMGPASVMIGILVSQDQAGIGQPVKVAIVGAQHAPGLISHLQSRDISLDTDAGAKLEIPSDYQERLSSGTPIKLTLTGSRRDDDRAMRSLESAITEYSQTLAVQRVILRGVSPAILRPVDVDMRNSDVATAFSLMLAQVMLFYFLVAPAGSGMSLAIDVTAGERERHSLETLLSRPVPRAAVVIGKWLAVICFGMLGVFVCGLVIYAASITGFIAQMGVRFDLVATDIFAACLLVLPFAGLIAALQITVGFAARSFKEAQAYIGFTLIIPIVLGLIASMDVISKPWVKKMPVFVEVAGLKNILTSNSISAPGWIFAVIIEFILIAALLALSTRRLDSGKMLAAD